MLELARGRDGTRLVELERYGPSHGDALPGTVPSGRARDVVIDLPGPGQPDQLRFRVMDDVLEDGAQPREP